MTYPLQVIPKAGGTLRIVSGQYSGKVARVLAIHTGKFQAEVELESGEVVFKEYEHICKLAE